MIERISHTALAATVGALLALGVVAGGVNIVTAPPDMNPASQEILVYGD